jgi:hypothetical protein
MPIVDSVDVESVVSGFINGLLGPYWPPEIRMVLDGYASITLPFEELETPALKLDVEWTLERFLGFVRTWSAVGRYVEECGDDPVLQLATQLEEISGSEEGLLPISYRLDLRAGRV